MKVLSGSTDQKIDLGRFGYHPNCNLGFICKNVKNEQ